MNPIDELTGGESGITPGQVVDGYEVLRLIGRGGFGTVWLVRSKVTGNFQALKWIRSSDSKLIEKELHALEKFKQAASRLREVNLIPIEHVNRLEWGLFYVMPLRMESAIFYRRIRHGYLIPWRIESLRSGSVRHGLAPNRSSNGSSSSSKQWRV